MPFQLFVPKAAEKVSQPPAEKSLAFARFRESLSSKGVHPIQAGFVVDQTQRMSAGCRSDAAFGVMAKPSSQIASRSCIPLTVHVTSQNVREDQETPLYGEKLERH